jgi:hypothetical protein
MQRYTVYFIWKLLYMFRVAPSPIIRSANCIYSIWYLSHRYTVYLYLETALHVSGGTSIHHQERKQLYLQHLVFVRPLLLSAAIVEELEPVWVCCGGRTTNLCPVRHLLELDSIPSSLRDFVVKCWWKRWLELAATFPFPHNLPDYDQQHSSRFSPAVSPEAPSAGVRSWWWAGRRPKHVEPHINVK